MMLVYEFSLFFNNYYLIQDQDLMINFHLSFFSKVYLILLMIFSLISFYATFYTFIFL